VVQHPAETSGARRPGRRAPARPAAPGAAQIHLIGAQDQDTPENSISANRTAALNVARRDHIALAVENLQEAKAELDRLEVQYHVQTGAVGAEQIFFQDPFGNVIELQEAR